MFTDHAKIFLKAGQGGNGCTSFRREKYVPLGGPNGGNGGAGGSIYFMCNKKLNTLNQFKKRAHFFSEKGSHGQGHGKTGCTGADVIIEVPLGTVVKNELGRILADLNVDGKDFLACQGGRGGRGNESFKCSTNQAPRIRELGEPGEENVILLELKLIADVGLVGFPNAGKSTLISVVSNCKPKIADYPFTTLVPNLGIVDLKEIDGFIIADIPGLIEGASEGKGLGHQFLRHVERVRALLFLIDINDISPSESFKKLHSELGKYSSKILEKEKFVAFTKRDTFDDEEYFLTFKKDLLENFEDLTENRIFFISSVTGLQVRDVMYVIKQTLDMIPKEYTQIGETHHLYTLPDSGEASVTMDDDVYVVSGKKVEKIIIMTDIDSESCLLRLQKQLIDMGVYEKLENAGINFGDNVRIGKFEFVWD
ncbi:GTPase ObgE [bacterium]|nr:GTPase ObgE [bacterium]